MSGFLVNHKIVWPSPLSNFRTFSSPPKEMILPLAGPPHSIPSSPSRRQPLIYFLSLDLPILELYTMWSFVTGFFHLANVWKEGEDLYPLPLSQRNIFWSFIVVLAFSLIGKFAGDSRNFCISASMVIEDWILSLPNVPMRLFSKDKLLY